MYASSQQAPPAQPPAAFATPIRPLDPAAAEGANTTLPNHRYYPGTVTLGIIQRNGVVGVHVVGDGKTGAHSTEDQTFGPVIFSGLMAGAYGALNPTTGQDFP